LANQPNNIDPNLLMDKVHERTEQKEIYGDVGKRGGAGSKQEKNMEKTNADRVTGWRRKWGTRR
jgi:hypothetical protein